MIDVGGRACGIDALRRDLLRDSPGASVASPTDFRLSEEALPPLAARLAGCTTLVCENSDRHADTDVAIRHRHMTTQLTATLAREAQAGEVSGGALTPRGAPARGDPRPRPRTGGARSRP